MSSSTIVLASSALSTRLGVEQGHMIDTIKAQCFRALRPEQVTDTQLAAYIQIANNLNLNPLLPGMLYAYPERNGGITPIIGPDGVFSLLSNNSDIEGWTTKHEKIDGEDACTATIKHKRLGDLSKTVFLSEWKVPNNPNWVSRPRHMLEIRALKQCARQVIHGIPFDEEEKVTSEINVTGTDGENQQAEVEKRPSAPARRGSAKAAGEASVAGAATTTKPKDDAIDVTATTTTESTTQPEKTDKAEQPPVVEKSVDKVADKIPVAPDIAPGVSMAGFHGKNWPLLIRFIVTEVKRAKTPQAKPLLILSIKNEDGAPAFVGECVTFEHVEMVEGQPVNKAAWLKSGAIIEANFTAKIRPDRQGQPDYSRPPALYAEQVTEATVESF